jgi:hypothetical protein
MECAVCGETPEQPIPCKCYRDALQKKSDIRDLKRRVIDIRAGVNAAVEDYVGRNRALNAALVKVFRISKKAWPIYYQARSIASALYDLGVRANNYKDIEL